MDEFSEKLEIAKKALEYYSNKETYKTIGLNYSIFIDKGDRAKEALNKIGGKNE